VPARRAKGEGSVYEDKKRGRFIGAVHIDGRRRKVTAKTRSEARTRLNEMLRKRDSGEPVGDGNMTVNDLMQRWIERDVASRRIAPATVQGYEWAADRLAGVTGATRLKSLSIETIEDAFDTLAEDGLSNASLRKILNALSQAMRFGVKRGYLNRNLADDVRIPLNETDERNRKVLTKEQVGSLLDALEDERLGALFALGVTVTLRPTECAALRWDAVDLDEGTVSVVAQRRRTTSDTVIVNKVKTSRSARVIRLPRRVAEMLRNHHERQLAERSVATRWADPTLVFATRDGTPLDAANVRRELKRILTKAELPLVTPYELRHTAGSVMSDAGLPLEVIADVMGHADTRMLERTYRHRLRPTVDAAAVVKDSLFDEAEDEADDAP